MKPTEAELEIERDIVGAALWIPEAAKIAVATMSADDFWRPSHRLVFEAIKALVEAGMGVDLNTVARVLGDRLDEAGGADYLYQMQEQCPSAANQRTYCEMTLETARLRRVHANARKLAAACEARTPLPDVLALAGGVAKGCAPPGSFAMDTASVFEAMDAASGPVSGVTTGFCVLDALNTAGGYPKGQMSVVAAFRKGGKTSFMLDSALYATLDLGMRVCYATFADMQAGHLVGRLMHKLTGWSKPPSRSLELAALWEDSKRVLIEQPVHWYDPRKRSRGEADVETFAAWLEATHDANPWDLVLVDYIQRVGTKRRVDGPTERVTRVSDEIASLAGRIGVPIVVGSQVTRDKDGGTKTKDAYAIEEDCGLLFLLEGERSDRPHDVEVKVTGRFGASGHSATLRWDPSKVRFTERLGGQ